jgi:two-component system response regulator FixJ
MCSSKTIAIVEDDDSLREAIDNLLRASGFITILYPSAHDFLNSSAPECDLLLTDVKMPGMTGLELQEELIARGSTLPVIVITALLDPMISKMAFDLGAVACLLKPVGEKTLMGAIQSAFDRHR